jgi:hypothetical protein
MNSISELYQFAAQGDIRLGSVNGLELVKDEGRIGAAFRQKLFEWKARMPNAEGPAWNLQLFTPHRVARPTDPCILGLHRAKATWGNGDLMDVFKQIEVPFITASDVPAFSLAITGVDTPTGPVAMMVLDSVDGDVFINLGANLGFWLAMWQFPVVLVASPDDFRMFPQPGMIDTVAELFRFANSVRQTRGNDFQASVQIITGGTS